jgi:hypothetical protein
MALTGRGLILGHWTLRVQHQTRNLLHNSLPGAGCRVISRSIAEYLVQAWDVCNSCKHNGAVLPLPSAPEGRGADGGDAMA